MAKDKWLCPLSGKKFKGPDFIRKHIFNKYAENVDVVKQETMFFNNYLKDPVRPELPENPNKKVAAASPKPMPPPGGIPNMSLARKNTVSHIPQEVEKEVFMKGLEEVESEQLTWEQIQERWWIIVILIWGLTFSEVFC